MDKAISDAPLYIQATVQQMIDCTPTIEAVPVVRGWWIDIFTSDREFIGVQCSVCRETQWGFDNFRRFCAFCGARMDGDSE